MAHLLQKLAPMHRLRSALDELMYEWRALHREQPRTAIVVAGAAVLLAAAPFLVAAWFVVSLGRGLPDLDALRRIGEMDQATSVFDDADKLAFTIYKEQRIEVPLANVSPYVVRALTSVEDQRFYDHHGFDVVRIAAAAWANLRHRRAVQGGSTLTQQLARQSFLTPDKTLRRKLQELILAARIERIYSKPDILGLYLNKVYFGDGLYGIEAAARGYLGKRAAELDVAESALLAGLVKSPSSYAPTVSLERAVARRNLVLQAMLDSGAIDRATWKNARAEKVILHDGLRSDEPHGLYFKEQVRLELVQRFGWQRVYQGGLRVFSTVNMPLQVAAETAVGESLKDLDQKRLALARRKAGAGHNPAPDPDPLQAALVSMDPGTGHVRAMVGGRDFESSHFNRAVQAHRQPGSAFKPFVYAAALEAGYTPASVISNLDDPVLTNAGNWMPEDEHSSQPSMTLRTALRTSSNRAAVHLLRDVGIGRTVRYVKTMGIGDMPAVPSLALGSGEVTVQAMTAAYAAFANGGQVPRPVLIRRVEDRDGRVLYEARDSSTTAVSPTTAYLMASMLRDVIDAGTAWPARRLGFMLPAAGKTGTTNDFHDAWFIGFTPTVVTGVWVGFDQPRTILPNGFAAQIAVPLWTAFMKVATRGDAADWLTPPPGITTATVCRISGKLATDACQDAPVVNADGSVERKSMVYTEYFVRGTEPKTYCDVHAPAGLPTRIATVSPIEPPPAPHAESAPAAAPPAPSAHAETAAEPPPAAEAPRKRGFWARLFGVGRKDDSHSDEPRSTDEQPRDKDGKRKRGG